MSIWGTVDASPDTLFSRSIGDCTLWIRRDKDEWSVAHRHQGSSADTTTPDDTEWTRFVSVTDDTAQITPALPDRPVVVRPESPIVLLPGRWGRFFFAVPLWIRICSVLEDEPATMIEIPSRQLSSTWFGSTANGELCYSIDTALGRSAEELSADESHAICEVEIRNGSKERLTFERVCIHVEHMVLFDVEGHHWTNKVRVVYRGANEISGLDLQDAPTGVDPNAEVVTAARLPLDRNLLRKSFHLIREITGI